MGCLMIVVIIVVILFLASVGGSNDSIKNTLTINDTSADPSFKRETIEWKDGEIYVHIKYTKTREIKTIKINGTYKMEGDKLIVYANSNYSGSQGITVKIGWVSSDNRIHFSNKDLVPYHNNFIKEFYDGSRGQFGDDFCNKQINLKQTKINEQTVAFVDANNKMIKAENGAVIAKFNGNPMEAGGTIIALFFEGWPSLDDNFKNLCRFWNMEQ